MRETLKEHAPGLTAAALLLMFLVPLKLLSSTPSPTSDAKEESTQDSSSALTLCDDYCDLVVPVSVNGKPLLFKVDTGAQLTIVDIRSLGLIPPYLGYMPLTGIFGGTAPFYLSTLNIVEVGGVAAKNVPAAVGDLKKWESDQKIDGVLGIDFLRNYKVVIDGDSLTLSEKEKK